MNFTFLSPPIVLTVSVLCRLLSPACQLPRRVRDTSFPLSLYPPLVTPHSSQVAFDRALDVTRRFHAAYALTHFAATNPGLKAQRWDICTLLDVSLHYWKPEELIFDHSHGLILGYPFLIL